MQDVLWFNRRHFDAGIDEQSKQLQLSVQSLVTKHDAIEKKQVVLEHKLLDEEKTVEKVVDDLSKANLLLSDMDGTIQHLSATKASKTDLEMIHNELTEV